MNDLRCYFCRQMVVPGEHHAAEDCRSALKEQRDNLEERVTELTAELARFRPVDPVTTGG